MVERRAEWGTFGRGAPVGTFVRIVNLPTMNTSVPNRLALIYRRRVRIGPVVTVDPPADAPQHRPPLGNRRRKTAIWPTVRLTAPQSAA